MDGLTIRDATDDDVAAILGLWRGDGVAPSTTDDPEAVRTLLSHPSSVLLVAEIDGSIAGSVIAGWDGWRGSLYRLVVAPDDRRRGVGAALVREGERHLVERGARRIAVLVLGDEDRAKAFWRAVGYEPDPKVIRAVRITET